MLLDNDASGRNGRSTEHIAKDITGFVLRQHGISLDPHAGLMASGLTSTDLVALLAEIKARWDVEVSVDLLFSGGSIAALAQHVANEVSAPGKGSLTGRRVAVGPAGPETEHRADPANARRALRQNIRLVLRGSGE